MAIAGVTVHALPNYYLLFYQNANYTEVQMSLFLVTGDYHNESHVWDRQCIIDGLKMEKKTIVKKFTHRLQKNKRIMKSWKTMKEERKKNMNKRKKIKKTCLVGITTKIHLLNVWWVLSTLFRSLKESFRMNFFKSVLYVGHRESVGPQCCLDLVFQIFVCLGYFEA